MERSYRQVSDLAIVANRWWRRLASRSERPCINFILDTKGWVQESRFEILRRYLGEFEFRMLTAKQFARRWKCGMLRGESIYFGSWRIAARLYRTRQVRILDCDFRHMMTSVTSHYNLGGGLNVERALPSGSEAEVIFADAVDILRRFEVVTANSSRLFDLLQPHIPEVIYAPNGVDIDFYTPRQGNTYNHGKIRIGWVGKKKGAKNIELLEEIKPFVREMGMQLEVVAPDKSVNGEDVLSADEMREFYRRIDYFLCTSWHEGTPNPALEAAACGVPVISTRVGNMPELICEGVTGLFIDPDSESILRVLRDKVKGLDGDAYQRMSEASRERAVRDWSWRENTENYRKAFNALYRNEEIDLG